MSHLRINILDEEEKEFYPAKFSNQTSTFDSTKQSNLPFNQENLYRVSLMLFNLLTAIQETVNGKPNL